MTRTSPLPAGYALRLATPADLPVVLHHREQMFREIHFEDQAALATAMTLSGPFFAEGLADGSYQGWLVFDQADETVVAGAGVVLVRFHPSPRNPAERRPVVANVYTEPGYRRRGLARHLLETLIDWTRDQGYRLLYLHTSPEGRPLYEALGFEPTNELRLDLRRP